jgi:hypothetical protein
MNADGEKVWMRCRAPKRPKGGCTSNYAIQVRSVGKPGHGCSIRYRCVGCGFVWYVNV